VSEPPPHKNFKILKKSREWASPLHMKINGVGEPPPHKNFKILKKSREWASPLHEMFEIGNFQNYQILKF
jgi:hypothetical protein